MKTKNLFFMTFIVLFGVIYESSVQAAGIILNTVYLQSPLSSVNAINSAHVGQFAREITDVVPGNFATNIAARRFHAPVIENSAYKNPYYATLKMMEDQVSSTSDPIEMAEVIYKIIQNKNPKMHYRVGVFLQKFSIVLKKILPDTRYEKMLMNHYKL